MAAPANTLLTTGGSAVVGQREDLSDLVSRIDPAETPIYSWCSSGTATNKGAHDWQTVDLATPALGTDAEGETFVNLAPKLTVRLSNACEIHSKVYGVSGTAQAVDTAGNTGSLNFQRLHFGLELRKTLELMLFKLQAKSTADPRIAAGLPAFAGVASVGATGVLPTGNGSTAVTMGTERAVTSDILKAGLKSGWTEGAQISLMFMSGIQKIAFDDAIPVDNIADNNVEIRANGAVICDTVAIWRSTFGDVRVVLDRIMDECSAAAGALLFAGQLVIGVDERSSYRPKVCPLPGRAFVNTKLAKVADADNEAVVWEGTVEVPNPKAILLIGGLNDAIP